jgi:DNA-binding response OmpR family regulator
MDGIIEKPLILVIDDESEFLTLVKSWETKCEFAFDIFNWKNFHPNEVFNKLIEKISGINNPALIIIDQILLGDLGTEIARKISQHNTLSLIPIILTTQHLMDESTRKALANGSIRDFLPKPILDEAAFARIRIVLKNAEIERANFLSKRVIIEYKEQFEELVDLISLGIKPHLINKIANQLMEKEMNGSIYDIHTNIFYETLLEYVFERESTISLQQIINQIESFPLHELPMEILNVQAVIDELKKYPDTPIKSTIKFLIDHLRKNIKEQISFYESLKSRKVIGFLPIPHHIIENLIHSKCDLTLFLNEEEEIPPHLNKHKILMVNIEDAEKAIQCAEGADVMIVDGFKSESREILINKDYYLNFIQNRINVSSIGIHLVPHRPRHIVGIKYNFQSQTKKTYYLN